MLTVIAGDGMPFAVDQTQETGDGLLSTPK